MERTNKQFDDLKEEEKDEIREYFIACQCSCERNAKKHPYIVNRGEVCQNVCIPMTL